MNHFFINNKAILTFLLMFFFATPLYAGDKQVIDIPAPNGFSIVKGDHGTYLSFLRSLSLKNENQISLWDGSTLNEDAYNSFAVLDLALLFKEDIEQCADFSMRLWAEYLKQNDELDDLSLFDFYGRSKSFIESGKTFHEYLYWHMKYSNSYSLKLGSQKVRLLEELEAGDMFVQNDSQEGIGHVSVVIDEAVNKDGHKIYLVGYSFMPAQQFHIEKADELFGVEGWFTAQGYQEYAQALFGSFGAPIIMRFERFSSKQK